MTVIQGQTLWRGFHWAFFINVQGLIICLRRFEAQLALGQLDQAQTELQTATESDVLGTRSTHADLETPAAHL